MWRFCSEPINSFSFLNWLFFYPLRQEYNTLKKQLFTRKLGRVKRWTRFLWQNWCNLFNGLCSGTIRVPYQLNVLFLRAIFILISLVEISNSCVFEVTIENKYLLSFVAMVLIMLRAAYLSYKYIFVHISFFRKRTSSGIQCIICNKYNFFLLSLLSGTSG